MNERVGLALGSLLPFDRVQYELARSIISLPIGNTDSLLIRTLGTAPTARANPRVQHVHDLRRNREVDELCSARDRHTSADSFVSAVASAETNKPGGLFWQVRAVRFILGRHAQTF